MEKAKSMAGYGDVFEQRKVNEIIAWGLGKTKQNKLVISTKNGERLL